MKYLKLFNETKFITQDDKEHIMDIFRDIIDEYDLVKIPRQQNILNSSSKSFKFLKYNGGELFFLLGVLQINISELKNNEKFKSDIEDFKKRLELDGFFINLNYDFDINDDILEIEIDKGQSLNFKLLNGRN